MSSSRRKALATLELIAAGSLFGCFLCGPGPQPPPTDTCNTPRAGTLTGVELATPQLDGRRFADDTVRDELPPRILAAGDILWRVRGGQGAEMVPVRLVYRGSDVPTCLQQDTQVTSGGQLGARNRDNVATYELEPGARATKTFWLPGAFGETVTLVSDTGGRKLELPIRTLTFGACASAAACPCSAALTGSREGLSDAGARLWNAYRACTDRCDGGSCEACAPEQRACADHYF